MVDIVWHLSKALRGLAASSFVLLEPQDHHHGVNKPRMKYHMEILSPHNHLS